MHSDQCLQASSHPVASSHPPGCPLYLDVRCSMLSVRCSVFAHQPFLSRPFASFAVKSHLSLLKPVPVTNLSLQNTTFAQCLQATCHPVATSHPPPPSGGSSPSPGQFLTALAPQGPPCPIGARTARPRVQALSTAGQFSGHPARIRVT